MGRLSKLFSLKQSNERRYKSQLRSRLLSSADQELYRQLRPFRFPLIAIVVMLLIGGLGYMITSDFSLMDGIYQAGMTFTTLGYTEVAPISTAGRFFTISYVLLGFVAFTFSMGLVIEVLKRGELMRVLRERQMIKSIARLSNHFIICFDNEFTSELAKEFNQNYTKYVVIDSSSELAERAKVHKYPYFIQADPHSEQAFLKGALASAKGIITLSSRLADNIAIIASVRLYEAQIKRESSRITPFIIISAAACTQEAERLKALGADNIVLPTRIAAQRLGAIAARPEMENLLEQYLYKRDNSIDIEEVKIPDESWVRLRRVKELGFRALANVSIVGIKESSGHFTPMPKGEASIPSGAKLLLIGTPEGIKKVKKIIKNKTAPAQTASQQNI